MMMMMMMTMMMMMMMMDDLAEWTIIFCVCCVLGDVRHQVDRCK